MISRQRLKRLVFNTLVLYKEESIESINTLITKLSKAIMAMGGVMRTFTSAGQITFPSNGKHSKIT
jgi:hypothetical protein